MPDALALIRRAKAEAKAKAAAPVPPPPPLPPLELRTVPPPAVRLPSMPDCSSYFPDFVSEVDEAILLQHILGAPPERWSPGNGRRTQNWGGRPGELRILENLPTWLQQLVAALVQHGAWPADEAPPNHVIINEYEPGAGITPHTDGPLYADRVAVLSLMSDVVIELHEPCDAAVACEEGTRLGRLLLRRRSLNVLSGEAYRCFHGFPARGADLVDSTVANFAAARGVEGETVARVQRVSIVFVSKLIL